MSDVPHFSYPFRFASPQAATSEQDSLEEIADCVLVTLLCPLGFRVELPTFGIPDPTFSSPNVDTDDLRVAIDFWEPRAAATFDQQPDLEDELVAHVLTYVQVRSEE